MIVVAGLAALQILPGLLKTPEPPPLAADIGLPRVKVVAPIAEHGGPAEAPSRGREAIRAATRNPERRGRLAGAAIIAATPARREVTRRASKPAAAAVPPTPAQPAAASPPQAPIAPAESQPAPAPEPPNDGSVEFAPH